MLMKMRSKMQNEKGFTLVELMVVVVILGILVAIAVPIYNSVTARAQKAACISNQRMIDGAVMQWQASDVDNEGEWPTSLEELSEYFQETPECPTGDNYIMPTATSGTKCSNTAHARDTSSP